MAQPAQRLNLPTYDAKIFDPHVAKSFLTQYEVYGETYNLTDGQKLNTLATALTGNAALWFSTLREDNPGITWPEVRTEFEEFWTAPVPRANRAALAADCKQQPNEEVRPFLVRCLSVAATAIPPPMGANLPEFSSTGTDADNAQRTITHRLTEAQGRILTSQYFRKQIAANLFIAGCHPNMRQALMLTSRWQTWEDLRAEAIRIQATIAPQHHSRQLQHFRSGQQVSAVDQDLLSQLQQAQPQPYHQPPAQQQQPQLQDVNAVSNRGKSSKGKSQKKKSFKASPHPNQPKTHEIPIQCHYCGGTYHTERHCLAKQSANAAATGAISNASQQHQQQVPLQQPVYFVQHQQPGPQLLPAPAAPAGHLQAQPPVHNGDALQQQLATMDLGAAPPHPAVF